ncbi:MAG: right-handed parallel beta-helix repeat-containing protein [Kiritimatiellales bacterium]|nr:right-handed parallel beta-helix repeat-containing protein [Kiritimatiellales bacterium]
MFNRGKWIGFGSMFLCGMACAAAMPVPRMLEPVNNKEPVVFHPSFSWSVPSNDESSVRIQIAVDEQFAALVDADVIHSVADWYVPARRLEPGRYWWRLRVESDSGGKGDWSEVLCFSIVEPEQTFLVSPETSLDEMRKIAVKAAGSRSARIQFAKGTYRFKPGFEETVFKWVGAENIILDGGGSRFIMQEPSAQLWKTEDCRNIQIGNFSYEYDPRPHTIATVVGTDAANGTLDAEIIEGFSDALYPRTVNQMFCYALNPADNRRPHPDRPGHLYLDPEKTIKTGDKTVRYSLPHPSEFPLLKDMQAGDRIVVCYRRWPLSYVQRCSDITLFDIELSRSESPFFMGGGNTDMKFLNLTTASEGKLYPSPPGWVTGNDRHGPWIEGCFFEAISDDGPNITGNLYLVDRQESLDTVRVKTGPVWQNPRWERGDVLVFWNPTNGCPLLETQIAEVMTSDKDLRNGYQTVRVKDAINGINPGMDMGVDTHVYNVSCQNNGFVARNNRLVCGRRFGFNVKANHALIEKTHFEALASSAVYLENEPGGWEGLCSGQVVIQNNVMAECGDSTDSARRRRASGVHVNLVRNPRLAETRWQGHRDILIRRNTITDWESVGIGVDNVRNVQIEDNGFENKTKSGFLLDENVGIFVGANTQDVRVEDNCFNDKRAFEQIHRD